MKHYTEYIPQELAEKLKEVGMPIEKSSKTLNGEYDYHITYAEVLDWLAEKGYYLTFFPDGMEKEDYSWKLHKTPTGGKFFGALFNTWHEAANRAILFAINKIKGEKK